jgi:hypothetical protein
MAACPRFKRMGKSRRRNAAYKKRRKELRRRKQAWKANTPKSLNAKKFMPGPRIILKKFIDQ